MTDPRLDLAGDAAFRAALPLHGAADPGNGGTTPGSFALAADLGGPRSFSSPDTPGMPAPSERTAWHFLPPGWRLEEHPEGCLGHGLAAHAGRPVRAAAPAGFAPVTQLEHARLGIVTPEMRRVAEREPHLTAEQVRDEVAAGRMIIPANTQSPAAQPRPDGDRPRQHAPRSTPTSAPRRCRRAPRRRSRSSAGPSAGAPTR